MAGSLLIQGTGTWSMPLCLPPTPKRPSSKSTPRPLHPPGKGKFDIFKSRALEGSMRPRGPARGRYS